MRLIIKDESPTEAAFVAKGDTSPGKSNGGRWGLKVKPLHERARRRQRNRPLVSTAFRKLDSTARAVSEALLQMLNGVTPYIPSIRVRESRDAIIVIGRLPSVDEETVKVVYDGRVLKVRGARTLQEELVRRTYRRIETVSRTFERAIPLYCEVHGDKIVATLREGMLTIHVPKKLGVPRAAKLRVPLETEAVAAQ